MQVNQDIIVIPSERQRRSIRYDGYDYAQPGAYFVTMVSQNRKCIFGAVCYGIVQLSDLGNIVFHYWNQIPVHFSNVMIEPFIVMPNHIHGIITIMEDDCRGTIYSAPTERNLSSEGDIDHQKKFGKPVAGSVSTIVRTFKAAVSRTARQKFGMINVWQRNYYDHSIRNHGELEKIAQYILANPHTWSTDPENLL